MGRDISPIRKLRESGISPDRSLGQNFLIDPNILDVIDRMAALGPRDCVLEVGPGLGILTGRLLERCRLVHCIEVDADLARHLRREFGGRDGFRLHVRDAVEVDLAGLDPPPDKFVANLPYNIATPLVLKSLEELPSIRRWCLMLQKEIADRLFAETGAPNYGGPSVMTRLLTERIEARHVSGNVFYPRPRVQSSLLTFRRKEETGYAGAHFAAVKSVVYACFSHRRKTLANSLAESGGRGYPRALSRLPVADRKRSVANALQTLGIATGVRAQDLTPGQHEQLAEIIWSAS